MPGKNNNMDHNLLDLKVSLMGLGYFAVSFSELDIAMKVITFILVSAFTIRRWWILEQNNKK